MPVYSVEHYNVIVESRSSSANRAAAIFLLDEDQNLYVGQITFYSEITESTPLASFNTDSSRIRLYYHLDQLSDILNILRNEKPVYIYYTNPNYAGIRTNLEPIGEEET